MPPAGSERQGCEQETPASAPCLPLAHYVNAESGWQFPSCSVELRLPRRGLASLFHYQQVFVYLQKPVEQSLLAVVGPIPIAGANPCRRRRGGHGRAAPQARPGSPARSTPSRYLFTYKNQWNSPTGYGWAVRRPGASMPVDVEGVVLLVAVHRQVAQAGIDRPFAGDLRNV